MAQIRGGADRCEIMMLLIESRDRAPQ